MILILGWQKAYLIEVTGSLLGVTTAYYLGKQYGEKIIRWIAVPVMILAWWLIWKFKGRNFEWYEYNFGLGLAAPETVTGFISAGI